MRAIFENIPKQTSIHVFEFEMTHFEFKWHYHPEYELTLITKGNGMRFVGDSYENFTDDDLVLLGSKIPHTWATEPNKNIKVSAVVAQFSEEFIANFLNLDDFKAIAKLLQSASNGLFFYKDSEIIKQIKRLPKENGVKQITLLLNILENLSKFNRKSLASNYYDIKINDHDQNRIAIVLDYLKQHSNENLSINEVAKLIHLSVGAFCKFFKKVTGKTFSDYLNDIRIGKACYLLSETDKTIYQIATEVGFENQSYFNRIFLIKKGSTPSQFRKLIL